MQWLKIWLLTPVLLLSGLSVNETILYAAKHKPSLVSDADLFCNAYSQVEELGQNDVLLLGASRMQTGFDLDVFHQQFPDRKVLLLAQSGRGTSYPVFKDIVENTNFSGIIIIDENEQTLISKVNDQQPFIDHCHASFSLNRKINRDINTWLQSHFIFLNPQSSSLRLWGNLIAKRQLPEPFYTTTVSDRQQLTDYARADARALYTLYQNRLNGIKQSVKQPFPNPEQWLKQTDHWHILVKQFQTRGGRVIFIRMPVSQERWEIERQVTPVDRYWQRFTTKLQVASLHFASYPELTSFELPDTSHLHVDDRPIFTRLLLDKLDSSLVAK